MLFRAAPFSIWLAQFCVHQCVAVDDCLGEVGGGVHVAGFHQNFDWDEQWFVEDGALGRFDFGNPNGEGLHGVFGFFDEPFTGVASDWFKGNFTALYVAFVTADTTGIYVIGAVFCEGEVKDAAPVKDGYFALAGFFGGVERGVDGRGERIYGAFERAFGKSRLGVNAVSGDRENCIDFLFVPSHEDRLIAVFAAIILAVGMQARAILCEQTTGLGQQPAFEDAVCNAFGFDLGRDFIGARGEYCLSVEGKYFHAAAKEPIRQIDGCDAEGFDVELNGFI